MQSKVTDAEWRIRVDLAATFRMIAFLDWHEGIANHFSAALSTDGKRFVMNPKWRHFAMIRASDLIILDADATDVMTTPNAPDPTAWHLHGTLHARLPQAKCVLHVHPPYATALSCLADPEVKPIDQTTARFFERVAYDTDYDGMADEADEADEGTRLTRILGDRKTLMMGNHGVLTIGSSIADAFDTLYHLERACRTLMIAYASGREVRMLSPEVATKTAKAWDKVAISADDHFSEFKRLLDRQDPSYAD